MSTPTAQEEATYRLEISSEHRLRSENLPFDIDVWYPVLAPFTYRTIFRPFTRPEAEAIMHYYQRRFMERKGFSTDDVQALVALERELDSLIQTHFPQTGAFLRLCGRSPKDAEPLDIEGLKRRYFENIERLQSSGCPDSPNTKLIAISQLNWMKVTSGKEVMSLLLTSERVFTDLHDWLKYGEPEQIVLREFDPDLSMDFEFRAFIHQNRVNALSQYDHYAVFPHVEAMKDTIQSAILELWAQVHPHVGQSSYVMDFVFVPHTGQAKVIEISPFLPCTGAALFSWTHSREIMENGPFEFRFNHANHPQLSDIIEANWDMRWAQTVLPYWEYYGLAAPSSLSWWAWGWKLWKSWSGSEQHLLFVYGTLKKGFHWNQKYLAHARLLGSATTTESYPMIFGDCHVPYLLYQAGQGHQICGEVWQIDQNMLIGMDDYEGLHKNYYSRELISVTLHPQDRPVHAFAYFKKSADESSDREFHREYTLEYHQEFYQPIRHIQVKQKQYLGTTDTEHLL